MPRRKKRSRRRSKVFTIGVLETGTALSLLAATDASAAVSQALDGDVSGGISQLQGNIENNKTKIIGTLAAAAVAKMITAGRRPVLARLGPVALRL